jgi:hypothetical protein
VGKQPRVTVRVEQLSLLFCEIGIGVVLQDRRRMTDRRGELVHRFAQEGGIERRRRRTDDEVIVAVQSAADKLSVQEDVVPATSSAEREDELVASSLSDECQAQMTPAPVRCLQIAS